ncbi:MAG: transposase [Planctomycetota bacterium]
MPRLARIDAPGALHHVIARGMERREIFRDDEDRRWFVERLGNALQEMRMPCYAWALMPNHFHLLLETGNEPVGRVMQSALTGYAVSFNRRHKRSGHLFQNRFKSILCERETYLLELLRYIHLNPYRARIAFSMAELDRYPWSGHAVLVGNREASFQAVDEILERFGKRPGDARRSYRRFVEEGISRGRRPDLTGGGLIRSLGGWEGVAEARRSGERQAFDERILGGGDFVLRTLKEAEEREKEKSRLRRSGWTPERVLARAAEAAGLKPEDLSKPGRRRAQSLGRWLASKWLVADLGVKGADVARLLGVTEAAVCVARRKGSEAEAKLGIRLEG